MSFPGSYNIRYYYGDTLEFRVFPKNASGEIFDLSTFTDVKFTLAENRDASVADHINCFARISSDRTNVLCAIRPEDAENIDPDRQYVYDVEISKEATPYPIIYTLLTGTVTITKDVSRPEDLTPEPELPVPNNPTDLLLVDATETSLTVSWEPPEEGQVPDFYKVAILPFTEDQETILNAIIESTFVLSSETTAFQFLDLDPDTEYSVIVVATNTEDVFDEETILTNQEPFSTLEIFVPPEILNNPEDLTFTSSTTSTLEVGWQPPTEGIEPTAYRVAIVGFTTDTLTLEGAIESSSLQTTGTSFLFEELDPDTEYSVIVVSLNSEGNFSLENLLTNDNAFITAAEEPPPSSADFEIVNDGAGAYLIDGISNDTITLVRGQTYTFDINAPGHPFWIQTSPPPYNSENVYNDGISGNGTEVGTLTWTVDSSAPSTLYYVCQFHSAMSGTILIIDEES